MSIHCEEFACVYRNFRRFHNLFSLLLHSSPADFNYSMVIQLVDLDFSPLVPEQFQMLLNVPDKIQALNPTKCCC